MCSVNYQEEYEKGRHFELKKGSDSGFHENIEGAADSSGLSKEKEDERPDFSKYFTGGASPVPSAASSNSDESSASGYVAPVDFGKFFVGTPFGKK